MRQVKFYKQLRNLNIWSTPQLKNLNCVRFSTSAKNRNVWEANLGRMNTRMDPYNAKKRNVLGFTSQMTAKLTEDDRSPRVEKTVGYLSFTRCIIHPSISSCSFCHPRRHTSSCTQECTQSCLVTHNRV